MTSNEQTIFYGRERNWLSKATFGRLMEEYIANPKSSDSQTNAKTNKPKPQEKTFISKDMYEDMKRALQVGVMTCIVFNYNINLHIARVNHLNIVMIAIFLGGLVISLY